MVYVHVWVLMGVEGSQRAWRDPDGHGVVLMGVEGS